MKKNKRLRKRAWVVVDFEHLHPTLLPFYEKHRNRRFIYLGDIPNQPDHCLALDFNPLGLVVFHLDDLVEVDVADT